MSERPMVSLYELDEDGVEQLVYREMGDEEFALHQAALAAAEEREQNPDPHPLVAAVESMSDEERAALRALLDG